MGENGTEIDRLEEARLLVQKAEEERQAACVAELKAILKKYGYMLSVTPAQIMLVRTEEA